MILSGPARWSWAGAGAAAQTGLRGQKVVPNDPAGAVGWWAGHRAIMIRWIFNDQFGIVNVVLEALDSRASVAGCTWSAFWHHPSDRHLAVDGLFTLLLLAGLQSLPKSRRGAAIDAPPPGACSGSDAADAAPGDRVCVVIRAIDAFRTFDIVWTLTGGRARPLTELFSLLCLTCTPSSISISARLGRRNHRRANHPRDRRGALPPRRPHHKA